MRKWTDMYARLANMYLRNKSIKHKMYNFNINFYIGDFECYTLSSCIQQLNRLQGYVIVSQIESNVYSFTDNSQPISFCKLHLNHCSQLKWPVASRTTDQNRELIMKQNCSAYVKYVTIN